MADSEQLEVILSRHRAKRVTTALAVSGVGVALLGATAVPTRAPGGSYKGKTSNGLAVTFRVQSRDPRCLPV